MLAMALHGEHLEQLNSASTQRGTTHWTGIHSLWIQGGGWYIHAPSFPSSPPLLLSLPSSSLSCPQKAVWSTSCLQPTHPEENGRHAHGSKSPYTSCASHMTWFWMHMCDHACVQISIGLQACLQVGRLMDEGR